MLGEFAALGIEGTLPVSAAHSRGITAVLNVLIPQLPAPDETDTAAAEEGIRVAVVGRPNGRQVDAGSIACSAKSA